MPAGPNPSPPPVPATPSPSPLEEALRFADGLVPEAPPRRRGLFLFGLLALLVVGDRPAAKGQLKRFLIACKGD